MVSAGRIAASGLRGELTTVVVVCWAVVSVIRRPALAEERMHMRNKLFAAAAATALVGLTGLSASYAATPGTDQVTEAEVTRQAENTPPSDDWVLYTRVGTPPTAGAFVDGPADPPLGAGSLQLSTVTGGEKVFLFNYEHVGTRLADVDDVSYSTYRQAGSAQQVAALNIVIDFNGPNTAGGFSTLVFEPVYNTDQGAVVSGAWQDWNADGSGTWWSTRPINGQCAGATDACDKTWAEIVANNPDATVLEGVGINQGSGNAGLVSNVDAFTFDETTYDFERIKDLDGDGVADTAPPTSKDQCKKDGYKNFNNPTFKNQGDCVSYVATGGKNPPKG